MLHHINAISDFNVRRRTGQPLISPPHDHRRRIDDDADDDDSDDSDDDNADNDYDYDSDVGRLRR